MPLPSGRIPKIQLLLTVVAYGCKTIIGCTKLLFPREIHDSGGPFS